MKLIDKADVAEKIDSLQDATMDENRNFLSSYHEGIFNGLSEIEAFIDNLEVKEIDLEKEIELVKGDYEQVNVAWNNDFDYIARHFFELGLKTKGE